jgi:hypothetical protein
MTLPLTSADYHARVTARPKRVAPTGENPYAQQFGVLPHAEIRRLIEKHGVPSSCGRTTEMTRFTQSEIGRMAECQSSLFAQFCCGRPTLGRDALRRLCRILAQIEEGRLVKIDGWPVMLFEPKAPPPETRYTVALDVDRGGRLVHRVGVTTKKPERVSMPRAFGELRTNR